MDRGAILQQLDAERRGPALAAEVRTRCPPVTRVHASDGTHHGVIYSALDESVADDVIAREVDHHRALRVAFEWKLYAHDRPADLADRLRRAGFAVGPHEAVLVLDLADPPAWVNETTGVTVRRTDGVDVIADHRKVAEAVFEKDFSFTTNQLIENLDAGSTDHRAYVAYAPGGQPASIGRLYTHPASAFGGLYGGGTLPAFRGQGFYRATVAARARDARMLSAKYLIVDARPTSRPILESIGFEHLTDTWPCDWTPGKP